jgi:hypothetical protein
MKTFEITMEGKNARLTINGPLDETVSLPAMTKCETLVIDFDGLTIFNSAGVRTWLIWSREKRGYGNLVLENCRAGFIRQASYVENLIPDFARVKSFYVTFFNPKTEEQVQAKLEWGKDFDQNKLSLPSPKSAKGDPLELDVDDSYFDFLKLRNP